MTMNKTQFEAKTGSKISDRRFAKVDYVYYNDVDFQCEDDLYRFWNEHGFEGIQEKWVALRCSEKHVLMWGW